MSSLIFAIEAVAPIILMVAIGYVLKKKGFLTVDMSKVLNKLVFRVFLPVMLFLNVYKIESLVRIEFDYILYALIATAAIFARGNPPALAPSRWEPLSVAAHSSRLFKPLIQAAHSNRSPIKKTPRTSSEEFFLHPIYGQ